MKKKKKTKLQKKKDNPCSKYWRTKADTLWSKLIREREENKCVICGAKENIQAHHLISRDVKVLRHCLDNGISLCPSCHKFDRRLSAHRGAIPYALWLEEHRKSQHWWVMEHFLNEDEGWDYKEAYNRLKNDQVT